MKKYFVAYDIALALKEIGFKEECIGVWEKLERGWNSYTAWAGISEIEEFENELLLLTRNNLSPYYKNVIPAPLYDQVIDWFIKKHNIHITYVLLCSGENSNSGLWAAEITFMGTEKDSIGVDPFESRHLALDAGILKVIELVKETTHICDGGSWSHQECIYKGKRVPKCDGGCMYPGA